MIGIPVTREVALRVLQQLEAQLLADVSTAAQEGLVPRTPGYFKAWVDTREEQLLTLAALRSTVEALPRGAVLRPADTEAA